MTHPVLSPLAAFRRTVRAVRGARLAALVPFAGLTPLRGVAGLLAGLALPATSLAQAPSADPADVGSIDAILSAVYDVISGPAGERDWDRMRSLFVPGARLIVAVPDSAGGAEARVRTVEEYITGNAPFFRENGFFEREIGRRTETFGNVAHAFSTYESRHDAADPEPFTRGINSIQLLRDGERWWIVTIYWDSERPGNPIPPEYLRREPEGRTVSAGACDGDMFARLDFWLVDWQLIEVSRDGGRTWSAAFDGLYVPAYPGA